MRTIVSLSTNLKEFYSHLKKRMDTTTQMTARITITATGTAAFSMGSPSAAFFMSFTPCVRGIISATCYRAGGITS